MLQKNRYLFRGRITERKFRDLLRLPSKINRKKHIPHDRTLYRDRAFDTRPGRPNLRGPKLRQGSHFPGFPEARKTSEQALTAVIQGEPASRHRFETAGERDRRRLHPAGGRAGSGDGPERALEEHRLQAVQGMSHGAPLVREPWRTTNGSASS